LYAVHYRSAFVLVPISSVEEHHLRPVNCANRFCRLDCAATIFLGCAGIAGFDRPIPGFKHRRLLVHGFGFLCLVVVVAVMEEFFWRSFLLRCVIVEGLK
jgi:membrane protease YdiL (CAAX protease family)